MICILTAMPQGRSYYLMGAIGMLISSGFIVSVLSSLDHQRRSPQYQNGTNIHMFPSSFGIVRMVGALLAEKTARLYSNQSLCLSNKN